MAAQDLVMLSSVDREHQLQQISGWGVSRTTDPFSWRPHPARLQCFIVAAKAYSAQIELKLERPVSVTLWAPRVMDQGHGEEWGRDGHIRFR